MGLVVGEPVPVGVSEITSGGVSVYIGTKVSVLMPLSRRDDDGGRVG